MSSGGTSELQARRKSINANQSASPIKGPLSVNTKGDAVYINMAPEQEGNSATSSKAPESPTKAAMKNLDQSTMSLASFQAILGQCDLVSSEVSKKVNDSGKFMKVIQEIKIGYEARQQDIAFFIESPIASGDESQIKLLKASYYDVYKNLWGMNEYLKKVQHGMTFTSNSTKRKKLIDQAMEVQQAWNNMTINLTMLLARQSTKSVQDAELDIAKLAMAAGVEDFSLLDINDATSLFYQGEKYLLGFGVPQNYQLALKRYMLAAQAGVPNACHMLGTMFELGLGREKDLGSAIHWYTIAAEKKCLDSLNALGKIYEKGISVPADARKALECFHEAANGGNVDAMVNLGHMLEKVGIEFMTSDVGKASKKNPNDTAFRWYSKAAEQGYARAQNALGSCYFYGKGVEQDHHAAITYYRQAADQNDPHANNNLGVCYEEGTGVPKDTGLAKHYYKKAADQFHPSGVTNYGYILLLEGNYWDAFKNFHVGLSLGSAEAAYQLGTFYEAGCKDNAFLLEPDLRMALYYYNEAVSQALIRAGTILLTGPPELQKTHLAYNYLLRAAELDSCDAMNLMGQLLQMDIEITDIQLPNHKEAMKWYSKAIKGGSVAAIYNAAFMYETGVGVEKDFQRSVKMYQQASKLGFKEATERLAELQEMLLI